MMVRRGWNAGKSPPPGVTIKRMFRKRKITLEVERCS